MNSNELHRQAMDLADLLESFEEQITASGLSMEMKAAFFRSSASVALAAKAREDAIRLAECGLQCSPPEEIAAELREVIEQAKESHGEPQSSRPPLDSMGVDYHRC